MEVGTVVCLKSGGPWMTVTANKVEGQPENAVICCWFNEQQELGSIVVDFNALEVCGTEKPE